MTQADTSVATTTWATVTIPLTTTENALAKISVEKNHVFEDTDLFEEIIPTDDVEIIPQIIHDIDPIWPSRPIARAGQFLSTTPATT